MTIYPTISFEEYLAALDALTARKTKKSSSGTWLKMTVSILLVVIASFGIREPGPRGFVMGLLGLLIFCFIYSRLFARRNVIRCYRAIYDQELPSLSGQQLTIDETGITTTWPHGQSHCRWDGFVHRIDQPTDFLFLPSPNSFIRIPKKDLSQEQQETILTWSKASSGGNIR